MKVTLGNHPDMEYCLDQLADMYMTLGVEVVRMKSETPDSVFHRDVAAWTPFGMIKCSMAKETRRWEPDRWFSQMGITAALSVPDTDPEARFEGADLLWVYPTKVAKPDAIIGYGQRTNRLGAEIVGAWLTHEHGMDRVEYVALPPWHDQHLLGVVNVVAGRVCAYQYMADALHDWNPIVLPFSTYKRKGVNWVELPLTGHVLYNADCDSLDDVLTQYGKPRGMMSVGQLLRHQGGIACATGIVEG